MLPLVYPTRTRVTADACTTQTEWRLEIEHLVVYRIDALPIPEREHVLDHVRHQHHFRRALSALIFGPFLPLSGER